MGQQRGSIPVDKLEGWSVVEPPPQDIQQPNGAAAPDHGMLLNMISGGLEGGRNLLEGAGKKLASTIGRTGSMMSSPATDWLGNKSAELAGKAGLGPDVSQTKPASRERAFPAFEEGTKTEGKMQALGGGLEQIGEYFVGAGPARKAAIEGGVRLLPNNLSPKAMNVGNKLMAILGRSVGEGGNAAATSMLHGEENPDSEAAWAAAGPALGPIARKGVSAVAKSPLAQKVVPIAGAGALSHLVPDMGLGGALGTWSMLRALIEHGMTSPAATTGGGRTTEQLLSLLGRGAAGVNEQKRKSDRASRPEAPK